jgi:type I restriction enzyme M protein
MEQPSLNWVANFIWGIADDVLRDLYVRGKYRDVILPMTVLRRLDAVLEPTKQAVLDMKASLDKAGIVHQDHGGSFCNGGNDEKGSCYFAGRGYFVSRVQ